MKVAVIGLGKLGQPLVAVLATRGFLVAGYDSAPVLPTVAEPGLRALWGASDENIRIAPSVARAVENAQATFIIVPTPSKPSGAFSNEHVLAAVDAVGAALRGGDLYHVVAIVSTVMPGSCAGEIKERLEAASGRKVGEDLGLTYSPEFIALGTVIRDLERPDFVLIGESDKRAGDAIAEILYAVTRNDPPMHRMDLTSAEVTKLMVNAYVCTKISFANMAAELCAHVGADAHAVTSAMGDDRRIGEHGLRPGLGFGGPCLPRDTVAVQALKPNGLMREVEMENLYVAANLADRARAIAGSGKIAVLGQSYKPGTSVTEASQAVQITDYVRDGREVATYDPMAPCSSSLSDALEGAACVVIATPWPEFRELKTDAPVIDPWGLLR